MHYFYVWREGKMEYLKLDELTKKKLDETYIVNCIIKLSKFFLCIFSIIKLPFLKKW